MDRVILAVLVLLSATTSSATTIQYDFELTGILWSTGHEEIRKTFGGTASMYYDEQQVYSEYPVLTILDSSLDVDGTLITSNGSMRFGSNDGSLSLLSQEGSIDFTVMDGPYFTKEILDINSNLLTYQFDLPMNFTGGLATGSAGRLPQWFEDYIDIGFWDKSATGYYCVEADFSDGRIIDSAPIPEPATMILFGTGILAIIGSSLRLRKHPFL